MLYYTVSCYLLLFYVTSYPVINNSFARGDDHGVVTLPGAITWRRIVFEYFLDES
jgi:hypothetical protein